MPPDALRVSPPPVALTPEIRWVLLRGFGPPQQPPPEPLDGPLAVRVAGELSLVERIATRVASAQLVDEVGREAALQLSVSRLRTLARMRRLCALIPELASMAEEGEAPIVLAKFAALHVGGYVAEGARSAGDIDLLLRTGDARRMADRLRSRGFVVAETMTADHHLAPLQDAEGRTVELHTHLPGLKASGRRFARLDTLQAADGLERAPELGAWCYVLRRDALAAHLMAHGLAHHGGADAYPVTRALGDVIDLLPPGRVGRAARVRRWITDDVSVSELTAMLRLCDVLESGSLDGLDTAGDRHAEVLLRHVLAGALDDSYRSALAVAHVLHPLTDEPRLWKVVKTVTRAAFPTDAQLAARAGVPVSSRGRIRLRLAHVAAFAGRVSRLARNALRRGVGA